MSMRKIYNIRLKDEPDARITAIKNFKAEFNLPLMKAKEIVDELLVTRIITADGIKQKVYDLISWEPVWDVEDRFKKIFDCEVDTGNSYEGYVYKEPVPDEDTIKALEWFDNQSDEVKVMVELVGKWKNPPVFAACG